MKHRDFWIRESQLKTFNQYDPSYWDEFSESARDFEGRIMHIREVNPALDEAIQKMVEALEMLSKGCPVGQANGCTCLRDGAYIALETWRNK